MWLCVDYYYSASERAEIYELEYFVFYFFFVELINRSRLGNLGVYRHITQVTTAANDIFWEKKNLFYFMNKKKSRISISSSDYRVAYTDGNTVCVLHTWRAGQSIYIQQGVVACTRVFWIVTSFVMTTFHQSPRLAPKWRSNSKFRIASLHCGLEKKNKFHLELYIPPGHTAHHDKFIGIYDAVGLCAG